MKKLFLGLLLAPACAFASYRVESRIELENKTIERAHLIEDGDHVAYPCEGVILDAVVVADAQDTAVYTVRLTVVNQSNETVGQEEKQAEWGSELVFECPSDHATATLTMKVTQQEESSQEQ